MSEPIEPPVVFNMDLANGPTSARFCYEAAAVLDLKIGEADRDILDNPNERFSEEQSLLTDEWTSALDSAGYYVWWNAGDVVVFDLRDLSDDDRDQFFAEMETV